MTPPAKKPLGQSAALPETIRPELNIEKWSIWQPANARTELRKRVFERTVETINGTKVTAKLTIAPNIEGNLTTEDQRVYYALVKLWEEKGRSQSFTGFSLRTLAKILKRPWSRQTIDSLQRSLTRLRLTGFIWEKAFEDGSRKNFLGVLHPFTILDDLKIIEQKHDGHVTKEAGYFRFHEAVLKNLLADYTKPVLFDVVLSFRSEVAQLLYTHLDIVLADKSSYERRTKELFEDLGLEGSTYRYASKRREKLEPALRELEGKPLTTGVIVKAALEPAKDGKDLKLVVRKGRAGKSIPAHPEPSGVVPLFPAQPEVGENAEAQDLVRHFHRLFHEMEEAQPSSRALDQAAVLIARHGPRKAKHIIGFAHREAGRTGFKAATFGAVIQYEARAAKEFDDQEHAEREQLRRKHAEKAQRQQETAQADADEKAFVDFWDSKTKEEREAFTAEAIEHAQSNGFGFTLRHYRQQPDPESPAAKRYLRMLLMARFVATRLTQ